MIMFAEKPICPIDDHQLIWYDQYHKDRGYHCSSCGFDIGYKSNIPVSYLIAAKRPHILARLGKDYAEGHLKSDANDTTWKKFPFMKRLKESRDRAVNILREYNERTKGQEFTTWKEILLGLEIEKSFIT